MSCVCTIENQKLVVAAGLRAAQEKHPNQPTNSLVINIKISLSLETTVLAKLSALSNFRIQITFFGIALSRLNLITFLINKQGQNVECSFFEIILCRQIDILQSHKQCYDIVLNITLCIEKTVFIQIANSFLFI